MWSRSIARFIALCSALLMMNMACRAPAASPAPELESLPPASVVVLPAVVEPTATPIRTSATPILTAEPSVPAPVYDGPLSPPCGILLPSLPVAASPAEMRVDAGDSIMAQLQSQIPQDARPALQRLFDAPENAGLVAFQAGREAEGVYWNADAPMPIASVAKIITLVAYAEAIAGGELNPSEPVLLTELERYYLPGFDLGAHRRALTQLRAEGRILSPEENQAVSLDDVAWMMIRHSSNAAADYLHARLGQQRIEETAIWLGLNQSPGSHSAPCSLLGQFLMMGNHTRGIVNDRAILGELAGSDPGRPADYGSQVALLADIYANQSAFRLEEQAWRSRTNRPSLDAQRFFAEHLAPQGTAGNYARLMSRLAQNGLSNGDSSFHARRLLEWTNLFPANQELFSNIGYKDGSLPGILTTVYYAYRWNDPAPVVVVLFYRDLPQQTYRQWRSDLPHDALSRWLLADPEAIPALSAALRQATSP